ncbi:MAG: hypothetical protein IJ661_11535 [Lachnospiraceae bacterium]|nr:hypothetical protein [Lachnospiraceae bacterium]
MMLAGCGQSGNADVINDTAGTEAEITVGTIGLDDNEQIVDSAEKTLIPFSTHAGSGLSGFDSKLSAACTEASIGTGLAIAGTDAQNDKDSVKQSVDEWLNGLGY